MRKIEIHPETSELDYICYNARNKLYMASKLATRNVTMSETHEYKYRYKR